MPHKAHKSTITTPITNTILIGDALARLRDIPDESIQCCVTSPPYLRLRDYQHEGQLGLEKTPGMYVQSLVEVFREVRRVLRKDGCLWLNLGDSYANKNLIGIPWRVAFALQQDGWYLRQDIIWSKPNPMPESVTDRCTKSHEYIFLLSKSAKYYYDNEATKEPCTSTDGSQRDRDASRLNNTPGRTRMGGLTTNHYTTRNKRSVWTVNTKPYSGAHFAVFPEELITPCILAGSKKNDTILDPFAGSGTTLATAYKHDRNYIGIELNELYLPLIQQRINKVSRQSSIFDTQD